MQPQERPGALVCGLVLAEANFLRVGVEVKGFLETVEGDGVQHFDAHDGNIVSVVLGPALFQLVVELSGDEEDLLYLVYVPDDVVIAVYKAGVVDHGVEFLHVGEFVNR